MCFRFDYIKIFQCIIYIYTWKKRKFKLINIYIEFKEKTDLGNNETFPEIKTKFIQLWIY